jgi:hypothetical protein
MGQLREIRFSGLEAKIQLLGQLGVVQLQQGEHHLIQAGSALEKQAGGGWAEPVMLQLPQGCKLFELLLDASLHPAVEQIGGVQLLQGLRCRPLNQGL